MSLLLVVGSCAVAAPAVAGGEADDGVERARAAGIEVDATAAVIMARAPRGSCLNDPTLDGCPQTTSIVGDADGAAFDGVTAYAPLTERPTAEGADVAVAQVPQCFLKGEPPYRSGGWMWAYGRQYCTSAITVQELYVSLQRDWHNNGDWANLDTRWAKGGPGSDVSRTASYDCEHISVRPYRNLTQGYAQLKGTWYAAQQIDRKDRRC